MIEHNINKLNNFICGWYLEDTSICEVLIDYFENSPNKIQGRFSNNVVDTSQKKSVDVGLSDSNLINLYHFYYVKPILDHYKEKYQYCNAYSPWGLVETISPLSKNASDILIACDRRPPGLFLKSKMYPLIFVLCLLHKLSKQRN